jgi:hypothetical protein
VNLHLGPRPLATLVIVVYKRIAPVPLACLLPRTLDERQRLVDRLGLILGTRRRHDRRLGGRAHDSPKDDDRPSI